MTAVTAFGSSVCNYTKGELLIHAANRGLLRPDAHQRGFLGLINFGSGLIFSHRLVDDVRRQWTRRSVLAHGRGGQGL